MARNAAETYRQKRAQRDNGDESAAREFALVLRDLIRSPLMQCVRVKAVAKVRKRNCYSEAGMRALVWKNRLKAQRNAAEQASRAVIRRPFLTSALDDRRAGL